MKKIFYLLLPIILLGYLAASASMPQDNQPKTEINNETLLNKAKKNKSFDNPAENLKTDLNCKSCHMSEYPTKTDPGLWNCPRVKMVSVYHPPQEGPDVVVIDEMSDNYKGVVFSHKVHSEMSEMSTGCTGCHHYNTSGPILNCRNCHDKNRSREDISVPDLKAAYHRQCMTCHKQWSNENGCNNQCHLGKGTDRQQTIETIKGKTHPELPEPTKITWETNSKVNKTVTFFHDEHIKLFKINCTGCHNQESCIKCHQSKTREDNNKPIKIEKSFEEHHKPCSNCHYGNSCQKCHNDKELAPFEHGKTSGWPLTAYHSKLACEKCHGNSMPYRKLDNNCVSCHRNFTEKFDHKLKGLIFSEAHSELECENCHSKKDFTEGPVCTDCHDDKSFPADVPGNRIKK